jgi:homoserine trans-succinylase
MFWFDDRIDLAPAFTPAVCMSVWPVKVIGPTDCFTFWPQPVSVFGWSMLTMPAAVHICWACHPA